MFRRPDVCQNAMQAPPAISIVIVKRGRRPLDDRIRDTPTAAPLLIRVGRCVRGGCYFPRACWKIY